MGRRPIAKDHMEYVHLGKSYVGILGWLLLRVNLTGLRDVQTAGKTLFLGVFVRLYPQKLAFELKD